MVSEDKMDTIRQIGTVVLVPVYFLGGVFISIILSDLLGLWEYFLFALVIPTIGLVSTKYLAPYYKKFNIIFVYTIGNFLAYVAVCPAYYPKAHELAYTETYAPFIITFVWSFLLASLLIYNEVRKSKPSPIAKECTA
jgi:hypothetical protein